MAISEERSRTEAVMALCRYGGTGARLFEILLRRFGGVEAIIGAEREDLMNVPGMTRDRAESILEATKRRPEAGQYLDSLLEREIDVVTRLEPRYPARFLQINDPPPLLYVRGRTPDETRRTLALGGAEESTGEGIELTVELAAACAEADVQVVASLRHGIDAAAHIGCKGAAGTSFAVLDSGLDDLDPVAGRPLAIDIVQAGGVISEYPPEVVAEEQVPFPSNRLIAGLAQAVLVTELYQDSYRALDLLRCCHDLGLLAFFLVDEDRGPLADESSLHAAVADGTIVMVGRDKITDIIEALV